MELSTILIIGGVVAVLLLIVGLIVTANEDRYVVEARMTKYTKEELKAIKKGEKSAPLTDWLNNTAERFSWGEGISKELARADLKLKIGEYMALMLISSSTVAILGYMGSGKNEVMAVIGGILGLFVPKIYVKMQQGKRLTRFNEQLADMLNLMVNGLRAGYSTMQAMEAVSKELPAPISDEFRRVVQEMQLGVSMERALDNLMRRIPSPDLDLVITAINVQREVGGNLAEILETISHTIRERVRIKGEVRVLTSQVMYSGRFLSLMPIFLILALYGMNREYFMRFFEEPKILGIAALVAVGLLISSGYFVMTRIATIEV
jgi:tight adherence protein B